MRRDGVYDPAAVDTARARWKLKGPLTAHAVVSTDFGNPEHEVNGRAKYSGEKVSRRGSVIHGVKLKVGVSVPVAVMQALPDEHSEKLGMDVHHFVGDAVRADAAPAGPEHRTTQRSQVARRVRWNGVRAALHVPLEHFVSAMPPFGGAKPNVPPGVHEGGPHTVAVSHSGAIRHGDEGH